MTRQHIENMEHLNELNIPWRLIILVNQSGMNGQEWPDTSQKVPDEIRLTFDSTQMTQMTSEDFFRWKKLNL